MDLKLKLKFKNNRGEKLSHIFKENYKILIKLNSKQRQKLKHKINLEKKLFYIFKGQKVNVKVQ